MTEGSTNARSMHPDPELRAKVAKAGLQHAFEHFPDDVAVAAAAAAQAVAVLRQLDPPGPSDEPWPPMRMAAR